MSWALLAFIVLILSYLGSGDGTQKIQLRYFWRVLLIISLSYAPAFLIEGADREAYSAIYDVVLERYDLAQAWKWMFFSTGEIEVGFVLLWKLFGLMKMNFDIAFFFTLIIVNSLMVSVLYKFQYPVAVFLLFVISEFYIQEPNIIRQLLACAIGLYGIKFIAERSLWKYLIFVLLAILIHNSAFLLILFVPFCFMKESWGKVISTGLVGLWGVSLVFGMKIITLDLPGLMYLMIDTRYDGYFDYVEYTKIGFDWFCNLVTIFYFVFCQKKHKTDIYAIFFVLCCIFTNFTTGIVTLRRLILYFVPIYFGYGPTLFANSQMSNNSKDKQVGLIVVLVFFIYYIRLLLLKF